MKTFFQLISLFLMAISCHATSFELKPALKENRLLAWVTAVHAVHDKAGAISYRLIEIDESGTVAANPIKLYLAVDSEDSEVPLLMKLPSVSELVSFKNVDGKLTIAAKFDVMSDTGVLSKGEVKQLVFSKSQVQKKTTYWLTEKSKR